MNHLFLNTDHAKKLLSPIKTYELVYILNKSKITKTRVDWTGSTKTSMIESICQNEYGLLDGIIIHFGTFEKWITHITQIIEEKREKRTNSKKEVAARQLANQNEKTKITRILDNLLITGKINKDDNELLQKVVRKALLYYYINKV